MTLRNKNITEKTDKKPKNSDVLEFRCQFCSKLLAKHNLKHTKIELKCLRCGNINSLLNDSLHQIFLTDARGKILYINEQVQHVTGYTPEEVLGKTPAVWGKQMPKEFYKNLWTEILENKKAVAVKITNRKKTGELYQAYSHISPILNENQEVIFFIGIQSLI